MRLFCIEGRSMKPVNALLVALFSLANASSAAGEIFVNLNFQTGANPSSKLVIDSVPTTAATFTNRYTLYLAQLDQDGEWSYSPELGYSPFKIVATGSHHTVPGSDGIVSGSYPVAALAENSYLQFIMVLYEHASGRYFHLSETLGGSGIDPHDMGELDPIFPSFPETYWPVSSTGAFYKGAEIPPFCVWLAKHDLVQADLAGLDADLVNQAFAVGANPTNFTSVSLAVGDVSFGANSITGGLSLVARDGAQNATAVTRLNGDAALSLLSSTTLGGVTSALPASFNLVGGTFDSTVGATNATQFLRLKLAVPDVW